MNVNISNKIDEQFVKIAAQMSGLGSFSGNPNWTLPHAAQNLMGKTPGMVELLSNAKEMSASARDTIMGFAKEMPEMIQRAKEDFANKDVAPEMGMTH